jgi:acyl-coenzyme A synthetase/AMP-(fatty) acid ligase/acyl carrier protein
MMQSFTVGSAITVLYPSLLFGGCLHVLSRERSLDAAGCGEYFARHGIDCLKIAPSHLAALTAASGSPGDLLPSVVVVAGEASPTNWIRDVGSLRPSSRIFNHYGTTETTIGVLTYPVQAGHGDAAAVVPLGRPLPNCRIHILDKALNPVPPGVVGEIHVAGDSLTRGYLGSAALTAEQFIPDPFSADPGCRLYRTKDIGRWLADGAVQYLGRADHQVKVRGFRVELGEVEAALVSHPQVHQAVARLQAVSATENLLVGYVVPRTGEAPNVGEVMRHLKVRLPDYMVPSAVVVLPALPRTSHGKVDRQALPALAVEAGAPAAYVAPRTEVEQTLAQIWCEVLQRKQVGTSDDFFALGGHSLMATRVVAAIRQALSVELPLRTLFDIPVLADLADRIDTIRWAAQGTQTMQTSSHQHEVGVL